MPWKEEALADIDRLRDEGRLQEALELCGRCLEREFDADFLYAKGRIHYLLRQYEMSLDAFEQVNALDSNNIAVWLNMASALYKLGRYEETLDTLTRALVLNPNDAFAWNNKGATLHLLGRNDEALDAYERALDLKPDYPHAWNGMGNSFDDLDRYEEALDAYERALELDPDHAYAWNGKGNTFKGLGLYEDARAAYGRALELEPDYAYAWNGMGNVSYSLGRHDQALDAYERALSLNPYLAISWHGKGLVYLMQGRDMLSGRCLRRFCALDSGRYFFQSHEVICKAFSTWAGSPFLLKRLAEEHPLVLTGAKWIDAYRACLDECGTALVLDAFLDSPLNSQLEPQRLLFKGVLAYFYGDAHMADTILTRLAEAGGGNLMVGYYQLEARSDYFQPAEDVAASALAEAGEALRSGSAAPPDLYYAGLVFSFLEVEGKALEAFRKARDFLPAMYQAAMLLDDWAGDDVLPRAEREVHAAERDHLIQEILIRERVNVALGRPLLVENVGAGIEFMTNPSWPDQMMLYVHAQEIAGAWELLEEFLDRRPEEDRGLVSGRGDGVPWSDRRRGEQGLRLAEDSLAEFEKDFAEVFRRDLRLVRDGLGKDFNMAEWEALATDELEVRLAARIRDKAGQDREEALYKGLVGYFMCSGRLDPATGMMLRFYLAALSGGKGGMSADNLFMRASFGALGGALGFVLAGLPGAVAGPMAAEAARSLYLYFRRHPEKPTSYSEFKSRYLEFAAQHDTSPTYWA